MSGPLLSEHGDDASAAIGACPGVLRRIGLPAVGLAVWRRPVPEGLSRRLDPLPPEALPHLRLESVAVAETREVLGAALPTRSKALAPLFDDVSLLAGLYGRLVGRPAVRLRLERITEDACRRFHADHVRLRLLCTYRGPGTEWLADAGDP